MLPPSCGVALAWTVPYPPVRGVQVVPSHEPMPNPIEMVEGGPTDVRSSVIWNPDEVTVNGCASRPPTWTVPEKFSVTSGDDGVVGSDEVGSSLEQPAAARAEATIRAVRICFTSPPLDIHYVAEGWRTGDKSNLVTAAISSA